MSRTLGPDAGIGHPFGTPPGLQAEDCGGAAPAGEVPPGCRRLHLGSGHLEKLPEGPRREFIQPIWLNLGPSEPWNPKPPSDRPLDLAGLPLRKRGLKLLRAARSRLQRRQQEPRWRAECERLRQECAGARVAPFWYEKGNQLPFPDGTFTFIYSEHFFEHLFLDEAAALFQECYRILHPGGVLRTSVPDADLRTYAPIEPPGINQMNQRPYEDVPWTHPGKHKTRWNIYSLSWVLEQTGFRTRPVVYCDKQGRYHQDWPTPADSAYDRVADREAVFSTSHIRRPESLIVDAIKL